MLSIKDQVKKQKPKKKRKSGVKKLKQAQVSMQKSLNQINKYRKKDFESITGVKQPPYVI